MADDSVWACESADRKSAGNARFFIGRKDFFVYTHGGGRGAQGRFRDPYRNDVVFDDGIFLSSSARRRNSVRIYDEKKRLESADFRFVVFAFRDDGNRVDRYGVCGRRVFVFPRVFRDRVARSELRMAADSFFFSRADAERVRMPL